MDEKMAAILEEERTAADLCGYFGGDNVERYEKARDSTDGAIEAALAERDALQARFDELNELFLGMRDRVAGYSEAPPAARLFDQGANAFEWAATSVRRAAAGEPPLDPPVPLREIGADGLTRDGELAREGWKRHILTCDSCGTQFLCTALVRVEHEPLEDNPAAARHYGRVIRDAEVTD